MGVVVHMNAQVSKKNPQKFERFLKYGMIYTETATRKLSSAGQSIRLITGRSWVRAPEFPSQDVCPFLKFVPFFCFSRQPQGCRLLCIKKTGRKSPFYQIARRTTANFSYPSTHHGRISSISSYNFAESGYTEKRKVERSSAAYSFTDMLSFSVSCLSATNLAAS